MQAQTILDAIQRVFDHQMDAWARGDAHAFAADFAPDAVFVTVRGDFVQGRPGIQANHAFIFSGPYRGSKLKESVDVIRFPAPGVAVAHLSVELSNVAAFPPGITPSEPGLLRTRFLLVLTQQNDTWQISSAQNTIVVSQPLR
ncbi:SgcJ/EcaC family oxidoreductase [Terriglobus aquaticus]|uniref:SgcJ/EcaC family oxidoreductase n=1 Tax=Terriglobus aquaticus TaxID=940139 RepID=A0ABW9KJT8_9BACT|nr:SgcJ/EcaC family oxidoreductase [Terriglobus aquaticus]